ncbi:DNA-binding MarR family transcriptional regulator [Rhodococcus sp. 27YEA15]|uniref:MarR family transcriptional regulator n=1 Tax=Rhodococcus sp. 27YEA15 TaxID=3156259 RepID=UPI003C7D47BB
MWIDGGASSKNSESAEVASALAGSMVRLRARLRRESADLAGGWSWTQLLTLTRIIEEGSSTVTELAAAEHVRPQSMTDTVRVLTKAGLVESAQDVNDRRRMQITPTAHGRKVARDLRTVRESWLAQAIAVSADPAQIRLLGEAAELINKLADESQLRVARQG